MQPRDIETIAELLGEAAAATSDVAEETHAAIAARAFRASGTAARPVQYLHDQIARGAYGATRQLLGGGARHAGRLLARRVPADAPALNTSIGGAVALAAAQGFVGDLLERRASPLATTLALHAHGMPVPPTPAGLSDAYPDASGELAIFIHGLCESEHAWRGLPRRGTQPARTPFPDQLTRDTTLTPLMVRYNTGRHISDNARDLAELIDAVVTHWPVPVTRIALIGHSMGGLVARSAAWQGRDARWAAQVDHVICLGTPHHGADLEQGVHLLDWALGQQPESRAFSRALRLRSAGIKDVRFGSASEADWSGHDPDELMRRRAAEVPFLPHAEYCWISASLAPRPLGRVLGDLLVRHPSASGQGRGVRVPFVAENGRALHGLTHFDLLDHPEVYAQLLRWLRRSQPAAALPAAS